MLPLNLPLRMVRILLLGSAALVTTGAMAHAQQVIEAAAYAGKPYGVGRVQLMVDPQVDLASASLTERNGRAQFHTFTAAEQRRVRRVLRDIVGAPQRVQVLFLFSGNGPLDLQLDGGPAFRIQPQVAPADHAAALATWWQSYAADEGRPANAPQLVSDYQLANLSRQLRLPLPAGSLEMDTSVDLLHAARVLGGAESLRGVWLRRVVSGQFENGAVADQPLPQGIVFVAPEPTVNGDPAVEPIANRVPPELFYARFGNFPNYLWFSHRMDDWGGEIGNLVQQRAIDYGLNNRQQEQLCLRETALTEVLGPTVISDVALVGYDMFMREGAAMGILFEARNSLLLANSIGGNRTEALRGDRTATEEKVLIGGKQVSFVSTPDNRLRSFYVSIDNYNMVTTSHRLVERFIQVASDGDSLGASAEFRHARQLFPIARNDAAFVYLSSPFLQNLVSPRYQVELQRRQRSLAELDAVLVAQMAAQARGQSDLSVAGLQKVGWLPANFGVRGDGSRLIDGGDQMVDSVRGPRGRFVPIPDVPIKAVTAAEASDCLAVGEQFATTWQQLTPVVAAVGRKPASKKGLEQVSLDVRLTPLAARQYQFLAERLGQPSQKKMATFDGDAIAFDLILTGNEFGGQAGADYHLFGGLRNLDPRMIGGTRMEKLLGLIGGSEIVGYIGSWPRAGALWLLGASAPVPVDAAGYSQFITGGWRRIVGQFTLFAFQRELLAEISPQLKFVEAPRPAQGWIRVQDLRNSTLGPAANALGFSKAVDLSRGNTWFINQLTQQLNVPSAHALAVAQGLLAGRLVCPAGGKYELVETAGGQTVWQSTVVPPVGQSLSPPESYLFPALYWLRGIEAEVRLTEQELAVHADVLMPVQERPQPAFTLPSFGLPFGGTRPAPPAKAEKPAAESLPAPKKPQGREF
jgi:hypothetical protein